MNDRAKGVDGPAVQLAIIPESKISASFADRLDVLAIMRVRRLEPKGQRSHS